MIIRYQSKRDLNGNALQLVIDDSEKTVKCGYYLFNGAFQTYTRLNSKKAIRELHNEYVNGGYIPVIEL